MDLERSLPSNPPDVFDTEGPAINHDIADRAPFIERVTKDIRTLTPRTRAGSMLVILLAAVQILTEVPIHEFDTIHQKIMRGEIEETASASKSKTTLARELTRIETRHAIEADDDSETDVLILDHAERISDQIQRDLVDREITRIVGRNAKAAQRKRVRGIAEAKLTFAHWLDQEASKSNRPEVPQIVPHMRDLVLQLVGNDEDLRRWHGRALRLFAGGYGSLGAFAHELPAHLRVSDDLITAAFRHKLELDEKERLTTAAATRTRNHRSIPTTT